MIENVCTKVIENMQKNDDTIDSDRAEVLVFGLTRIVEDTVKIVAIFIIAALLNMLPIVLFTTACMLICKSGYGRSSYENQHFLLYNDVN